MIDRKEMARKRAGVENEGSEGRMNDYYRIKFAD